MDKETAFEIVRRYIAHLKNNQFNIHEAYIFGSYASGRFHEDSDIDLAIVMNDVPNSFTMQVQLMKLSRKFDLRIEPHPFDKADFTLANPFAYEILTKGIQVA
ncbi:MAG: nucleotidyltransferase domain-containing protein [Anaerolinea sp.]|nr:nucleotidyltransferase domain-containing protein [Anaerolinea sp.]